MHPHSHTRLVLVGAVAFLTVARHIAHSFACAASITRQESSQVGLLVAYMLDASRQKEAALAALWITLALATTGSLLASWGHHGPLAMHALVYLASTGAHRRLWLSLRTQMSLTPLCLHDVFSAMRFMGNKPP